MPCGRFLLDSVADLELQLKDKSTELLTALAEPDSFVTELVHSLPESCSSVELYHYCQPGSQAESQEAAMAAALQRAAESKGECSPACSLPAQHKAIFFDPTSLEKKAQEGEPRLMPGRLAKQGQQVLGRNSISS